MLGFLFGNVDKDNRVEADYLEEVRSRPPRSRLAPADALLASPALPPLLLECRMPGKTLAGWPRCKGRWTCR
jgi:hypothetical protein